MKNACLFLCAYVFCAMALLGQGFGTIVGTVTDPYNDAFEFVHNAVFNARNYFAPACDQLKRNQYGGTLGGSVILPKLYNGRDKTFFFFGYQGTKIRTIGNTSSSYVPTTAERNGDFSALLDAKNPVIPFP